MFTQNGYRIYYLITILFFSTVVTAGQKWEYLVKTYPLLGNDDALTTTLNRLGKQQWELVNCTEGDAQLTCIFKRQEKDS
jgi:hypothetical protein